MIEMTFLKELILVKQVHQKSVIFGNIDWYFLDKRFKFQLYACTGFHDICLLIAILSINSADYRCITNRITKKDAANIFQQADLTEKRGAL